MQPSKSRTIAGDEMTNNLPPKDYAGIPILQTLPSGTILYRVHKKTFPADSFNPRPSHRYYGGGRFDATADDVYPYMYAGQTVDVAVVETLMRDILYDNSGHYVLPKKTYEGRCISAVETTTDLKLVSMRTRPQLSSFAQSPWITNCSPRDYAQTGHWAHWVRSKSPKAAGFVWNSRQEPSLQAYVLFGDRFLGKMMKQVGNPHIPTGDAADFDSSEGLDTLSAILSPYNVSV